MASEKSSADEMYESAVERGIEKKWASHCPEMMECPHCGGEAKLVEGDPWGHDYFAVQCDECGAMSDYYDRPSFAIQVWNRRDGEGA
jgi:Lar family restriction alleviation protein